MTTARASMLDGTRRAAVLRLIATALLSPVLLSIALVSVNAIGYFCVLLTAPVLYALWVAGADAVGLLRGSGVAPRPSYRWFLVSAGVFVVWLFVTFRGLELIGIEL